MKAQELRIGNLGRLFLGITNDVRQYRYIQIKGVMNEFGDDRYLINHTWVSISDNLEGIPISEEILLKCGFKHTAPFNESHKQWHIKSQIPSLHITVRRVLLYKKEAFSLFNHSECDSSLLQFIAHVDYLHQLQNLYFALTGEELDVKL